MTRNGQGRNEEGMSASRAGATAVTDATAQQYADDAYKEVDRQSITAGRDNWILKCHDF